MDKEHDMYGYPIYPDIAIIIAGLTGLSVENIEDVANTYAISYQDIYECVKNVGTEIFLIHIRKHFTREILEEGTVWRGVLNMEAAEEEFNVLKNCKSAEQLLKMNSRIAETAAEQIKCGWMTSDRRILGLTVPCSRRLTVAHLQVEKGWNTEDIEVLRLVDGDGNPVAMYQVECNCWEPKNVEAAKILTADGSPLVFHLSLPDDASYNPKWCNMEILEIRSGIYPHETYAHHLAEFKKMDFYDNEILGLTDDRGETVADLIRIRDLMKKYNMEVCHGRYIADLYGITSGELVEFARMIGTDEFRRHIGKYFAMDEKGTFSVADSEQGKSDYRKWYIPFFNESRNSFQDVKMAGEVIGVSFQDFRDFCHWKNDSEFISRVIDEAIFCSSRYDEGFDDENPVERFKKEFSEWRQETIQSNSHSEMKHDTVWSFSRAI